jgi:hypothetical protein
MSDQIREGGLRFPAVVLFTDGQRYWLADGFHRVLAARQAGLSEFPAEVRAGTARDALLFSVSANGAHGLPPSPADKRRAVALLLADAEWGQWSDREIARRCQASHNLVRRVRRSLSGTPCQMRPRKVRRGDTVYEMRTETMTGPTTPTDPRPPAPEAPRPAGPCTLTDRLGIPLSAAASPAFEALAVFEEAERLQAQLAELVDRLAQGPGGAAFRQHLVRRFQDGRVRFSAPELQAFGQRLRSAAPYCGLCPRCRTRYAGRTHPACKLCGGRGWLSSSEFEACPGAEQQEIRRRQNQQMSGQTA